MDPIEQVIVCAQKSVTVHRRGVGTRTAGRYTPGTTTVGIVSMVVQPVGTNRARLLTGNTTTGSVKIWVSNSALAEAYAEGDLSQTPLGWTRLNFTPPNNADEAAPAPKGPPADLIAWDGRLYELTQELAWDDDGLIPLANFRAYTGTEWRASA